MATIKNRRLLVKGANGKLGRATVENLLSSGADNVSAGKRDTTLISDLFAKGADPRKLDFHKAASLVEAFYKVERGFIISHDARQGTAEDRVRGQLCFNIDANVITPPP
ncbi:NAD(P)H-binding protein [Rhizobium rhizogenes]|uniref:NAD(P)H-binding protein n=1 Tax=Rhizobium rhizogenes TaxID=359 RepID=UPI001573EAFA|nr:NAD(P)H-binding protein [Rhizobium rhizogenes]NTF46080.1 NAD(P)H-binding protein [Rhizobium rhizogenes]